MNMSIFTLIDSRDDGFSLIRSNCRFSRDNCMNEYYILGNGTLLVIAVVSEEGMFMLLKQPVNIITICIHTYS